MEKEKIKGFFKEFIKNYNSKDKQKIWLEKSNQFRAFWNNKIMGNESLNEKEMDEIIQILDSKGKGNKKENDSVAMVMIPQGAWYKMFEEIKKNNSLKEILDKIFKSPEEKIAPPIDELYKENNERKNYLTGKSANAINTLNFAFNPEKNLSIISLNDRKKVIEYFEIPGRIDFEKESTGNKVLLSNKIIIKWFRELLGKEILPRTICDFLYGPLKTYWKEIPDYQSIMLPLLEFSEDKKEYGLRDSIEYISNFFELSDSQRNERLSSGFDRIIDNRVGWARTYLKKAGLLESTKRGYLKITPRGLDALKQNPQKINVKFLMQFPEFVEFQSPKIKEPHEEDTEEERIEEVKTPQELIEEGIKEITKNLSSELLEKLRSNSPDFFEKVVVKLITKMGYGERTVVGGPYDGGIDGIIYQDVLGLDRIYLQAKRYNKKNLVSPNDIKHFIASLDLKGATKGIFITASKFVGNVKEICERTSKTIITIDGEELVGLMIKHNVGVTIKEKYEIKGIDENYFEE